MGRPAGDRAKSAAQTLSLLQAVGPSGAALFPSDQWLAKRRGVSVRTISRDLEDLEEAGFIKRQRRRFFKWGRILTKRFIHLVKQGAKHIAKFGKPIHVFRDLMTTYTFPPEVLAAFKADEEAERRRQALKADKDFQRKKHDVVNYRRLVHTAKGGYERGVEHSPHVKTILRLLDRRLRGEVP